MFPPAISASKYWCYCVILSFLVSFKCEILVLSLYCVIFLFLMSFKCEIWVLSLYCVILLFLASFKCEIYVFSLYCASCCFGCFSDVTFECSHFIVILCVLTLLCHLCCFWSFSEANFECSHCHGRFSSERILREHMRQHSKFSGCCCRDSGISVDE